MKQLFLLTFLVLTIIISPVYAQNVDQKCELTNFESVYNKHRQAKFDKVVEKAREYAQKHYIVNAAIVSDIDETLLNNEGYYKIYKTYTKEDWSEWVDKSEAILFQSTFDFLKWAKSRGYKIFFITGRTTSQKDATIKNLEKYNVEYDDIFFKPESYDKESVSFYKAGIRKKITDEGYKIIINIGDQNSDIKGGFGKGFKLPNPRYTIP